MLHGIHRNAALEPDKIYT